MKLFECQACGQLLYFENTRCESCGRRLGFLSWTQEVTALEPAGDGWRSLAEPQGSFRFCANAEHDVCNWLIPADSPDIYCTACRHNRVIPDLSLPDNVERWRRLEVAKHRLFYSLLRLKLPVAARSEDPRGLTFEFLADPAEPTPQSPRVLTGHDNGLITINIAEADDAERERRRHAMGEPYRTLLGHFRHEVGHYYWNVLIENDSSIEPFRQVFGDERRDYAAALQAHYANGPPDDWQSRFVSAYASAHPWEDWAETWAHYVHIVDTLETASVFGLRVRPSIRRGHEIAAAIEFDPYEEPDLNKLIAAWLPLTFAVNSLNRSMGLPDLYPFVLAPAVIGKLGFVHERVHRVMGRAMPDGNEAQVLKSVAAGLRNRVAAPPRG
jgi:hypothetical protein